LGQAGPNSLLELVNKSLIISGMTSFHAYAGRRARQIVPALGAQTIAVSLAQPDPLWAEDFRLFSTAFAAGLVFFGAFIG
jgi:hypothetical protein